MSGKYHLSDAQVAMLEERLRAERLEIVRQAVALRARLGNSAEEDIVIAKQINQQRGLGKLVERALQKIAVDRTRKRRTDREYGYCEDTGSEISFERLARTPWAPRTVAAAAEHERGKRLQRVGSGNIAATRTRAMREELSRPTRLREHRPGV